MNRILPFLAGFWCFLISCAGFVETMQTADWKTVNSAPFYRDLTEHDIIIPRTELSLLPVSLQKGHHGHIASLIPLLEAIQSRLDINSPYTRLPYVTVDGTGSPEAAFGNVSMFADENKCREKGLKKTDHIFVITQPSRRWQARWAARNTGYAIWIQVGVSVYKSRSDRREIQLGTGYRMRVPWLPSQDCQVPVVQIVGAVLNPHGRIIRVGAEAFYLDEGTCLNTLQELAECIEYKDVFHILTEHRRKDRVRYPMAWQVALDHLMNGLVPANSPQIRHSAL